MKYFLVITILFIGRTFGFSQTLELPANIQSPNAASLGKYGDIPVSYFTGTPNINIPLYKFNSHGIELDISLNYDASGVKIDDHPGWVGQNWSLNAGGVIIRSINGSADETSTIGTGCLPLGNLGFYFQGQALNLEAVNSHEDLINVAKNQALPNNDYMPDIFTFNFMGKSGKFFLDNTGNWKVLSDENLKIIFEFNEDITLPIEGEGFMPNQICKYPRIIRGLKILDDLGNTYVFGFQENGNSMEIGINFFDQASLFELNWWKSNAWYLTKVIDKYQNIIYELEYTRESYDKIARIYRSIGSSSSSYYGHCSSAPNIDLYAVEGELIYPVYLSKITSVQDNLSIIFESEISNELNYNPQDIQAKVANAILLSGWPNNYPSINPFYYLNGNATNATDLVNSLKWRKLTKITGPNKECVFTYNDVSTEKLNLLQLDIYGEGERNNPEAEKHSFKFYYNNYQSVPEYLSKKVDHWGYNRGFEYIIPQDLKDYDLQRTPNENFIQIGTLDSIEYPLGGYTSFKYEPNRYVSAVNDSRTNFTYCTGIGPGLRIRKIIDSDGINKYYNTYEYEEGILSYLPRYYFENWTQPLESGGYFNGDIFSVNSLIRLSNTYGSDIGYSKVIERRSDNSYIEYEYENFGNNGIFDNRPICSLSDANFSPYHKGSELHFMAGKLKKEIFFNNTGKPIKQINDVYRSYNELQNLINESYVIGSNATIRLVCPDGYSLEPMYTGTSYKVYYFDYDVIEEEIIDFIGETSVSKITTYLKEDHNINNSNIRCLRSESISATNGTINNLFLYPYDYTNLDELVNSFQINIPVKSVTSNNSNHIETKETTYHNGKFVPEYIRSKKSSSLVWNEEIHFNDYDTKGNLIHYTEKQKLSHSILWGQNFQSAIVSNAVNNGKTGSSSSELIELPFGNFAGFTSAMIFDETVIINVIDNSNATITLSQLFNPINPNGFQTCNFVLQNHSDYQQSPEFFHLNSDTMSKSFTMPAGNYSLEITTKDADLCVAGKFNYEAKVTAPLKYKECGYTGFESNEEAGNFFWWEPDSHCTLQPVFTGKRAKILYNPMSQDFRVGRHAEDHSGYQASVWVKGPTDVYLKIGIAGHDDINAKILNHEGGNNWNLLKVELPRVKIEPYFSEDLMLFVEVGLTSPDAIIDDIRFCPLDSKMTTYTYDPKVGITSISDENNKPILYEYDSFGRLIIERDYLGNILKKYDYNIKH